MAPDMITDGVNGFLAPVGDVGEIAKKASYIIENLDLRNKFRANGLETVKNYHWSVHCFFVQEKYLLRNIKLIIKIEQFESIIERTGSLICKSQVFM